MTHQHDTTAVPVGRTFPTDTAVDFVVIGSGVSGASVARELTRQGFGVDARKFHGELVVRKADRRLHLSYDGQEGPHFAIEKEAYDVRQSVLPGRDG